jgi:hypothetical protein
MRRKTWYRTPSDSLGVKLGTDPHKLAIIFTVTRLYTYLLVFVKRSISLIILCKTGEIDIYFTERIEIDNSPVKVNCR